ncbi:MAG TPA: hypothetical protein VIG33_14685 [Pseudobdellovibrionaceae bacterium]|jgi:hypothetical protein
MRNIILNILYYGFILSVIFFFSYIGFEADFYLKKQAVKEAIKEMKSEK